MNSDELKDRTKKFALKIIKLANDLPKNSVSRIIEKQLVRAGTSVGTNYRAACIAKSNADFIYRINVVEEEADETQFWLELIIEAGLLKEDLVNPILKEAKELTAIFTSAGKTAKSKR
jgi:four helix bundle protein